MQPMQPNMNFSLIINAQEMLVSYWPRKFADYAHFEFSSPHTPAKRILISETGYKSHFSPMHEIEEAPSVEEYARALALAFLNCKAIPDNYEKDEEREAEEQFSLF